MDKVQKETFKVKVDDEEVELAVRRPTPEDLKRAQTAFNTAYWEAISPNDNTKKVLVRAHVDSILKAQGLWDDDKDKKLNSIDIRILENTRKLQKLNKDDVEAVTKGYNLAIQILKDKNERARLIAPRSDFDSNTADAQAENAKFNKLLQLCLVYNHNAEPYFKSVEEMLESSDNPALLKAYPILMKFQYGTDPVELKFLKENKFMDEKGRLRNNQNRVVNLDGKLIDKYGRLINEDNQLVDENGVVQDVNPVDTLVNDSEDEQES